MKLWRISNYADLLGIGGLKTPGRWHNKGIPVVYLAESPALALLETLVHFELDLQEVPENYQLLEVEFTSEEGISHLAQAHLPSAWQQNLEFTRALGDQWLGSQQSALLRVPSAIVPHSYNYLFNPRHPLAAHMHVLSSARHPYDQRLLM